MILDKVINFNDQDFVIMEPFHDMVKNQGKYINAMNLWHLNNVQFFSHKYATETICTQ